MMRQISAIRRNERIELNICDCGWSGEDSEMILWGALLVCPLCGK